MHFELLRTGNKINYYVRAPGGAGIVITCVYVNIKLSACVSVCPQGRLTHERLDGCQPPNLLGMGKGDPL